ncbi:hypothetical protein N431DRAFT_470868 [Stipitochalara longipes BDJ]|nr:hypothetical protein N431DRAFT_470868 [Stipitochalara longipes BDJ]
MAPKSVSLTVRYSKPGSQPPIFLAGSFSDPAWHPQEMQYTTNEAGEHDFYKEVQVEEGGAYQYKFRIGEGDWELNEDSPTVTDDVGNRNNLLSVPVSEEQTTEPEHDEHPPAAEEATSHPIAEMVNTISEHISGEKAVESAPVDAKDEEHAKEETTEEHHPEPEEHVKKDTTEEQHTGPEEYAKEETTEEQHTEPEEHAKEETTEEHHPEPEEHVKKDTTEEQHTEPEEHAKEEMTEEHHPEPEEHLKEETMEEQHPEPKEHAEEETTQEQHPEPKEHATITPAHTNTPVPETVEDVSEADTPEVAEIPEEVQSNVHHIHEDASISPAAEDDNARAQHVADALLQPTDGTQSHEPEGQAASESLTIPSGTVEPTSTPAAQPDEESPETVASPTLIVEKVDDELRHGDDFGSAATVAQKDAHLLRLQDAVPDHVITRSESRTPELAETAAEVSESAALLDRDRDPPTPPMSDEEAGRIGYRRMSSTPIPEVAKTAAEVADVAATLHDRPALHLETAPEASAIRDDDEDLLDSGASTPESQKAPRFSYECLGEEDIGVPALPTHSRSPTDPLEPVRSPYEEPVVVDWNDPSIEMFPTDRAGIINTIQRLTEHLPEDVPNLDIVPPSPVIGPNGQIWEGRSPAPSPAVLAHQISPSLDSITEEHDELHETLVSLPPASKLTSRDSDKENTSLNKWLDNSMTVADGDEKTKLDGTHEAVESETTKSAGVESENVAPEPAELVVQAKDEVETEALNEEPVEETREPELSSTSNVEETTAKETEPIVQAKDEIGTKALNEEVVAESREPEASSTSKVEETTAEETKEPPIVELPQGSGELELTSEEQREETITAPEEISSEVKEVSPESPPPGPVEQTSSEEVHVPSPETPLVVSDKQLGNEDEVREITTDGDSPNIIVQPATPAASKSEFVPKPLDTAKTTAIEEENGRQVKSRKNPRSQSPERPITPSSMRSATRDTKSKNFLKAFWHVLFVDWIGGLIRALCGGRGGYTLLAVSAIVVVVIAPTLYSSYTGSSLWR